MNLHDWIDEVSDVLDIDVEVDEGLVVDIARAASENVERTAAPITAYLLGFAAAHQAASTEEVEALAARVQSLADSWDRPSGARDPVDIDDDVPDDTGVDHSGDEFDD